jgi:hypothetical protein
MIEVKDTSQINKLTLNAKEACKILVSRKKYLVRVEGENSFTDDYLKTILRKYPDVSPDLVEVYELN